MTLPRAVTSRVLRPAIGQAATPRQRGECAAIADVAALAVGARGRG